MNTTEKAKLLKEAWAKSPNGKLMYNLYIMVCDDLDLLEELYRDDEIMLDILNSIKEEANIKNSEEFKQLYVHMYDNGDEHD